MKIGRSQAAPLSSVSALVPHAHVFIRYIEYCNLYCIILTVSLDCPFFDCPFGIVLY